ncbi:MAG: sigma-70 family RNA polymerase sigma factor [Opitutales bacterium]|nr:sigma-70 family RNA polymerase sigma factor [Opitutales bacterium]
MVLPKSPLSSKQPLSEPSNDIQRPNWELVKLYLPLVKSITKKTLAHFPDSIDRESIHTIGLLGLISASKSYNARKDARFGAYAAIRIRGALLDELRRLDWLPRHLRQKITRYNKTLKHWEQTLGRPLSDDEACNYLHLTKKQLNQVKQYLKPYVFISIDQPCDWDRENSSLLIANQLADHNQQTGIDAYEQKELYELLHHEVNQLPEKMQHMFQLHYQQGIHWSQIATLFQLSKSRICQMHTLMIQRIRKNLMKHLSNN